MIRQYTTAVILLAVIFLFQQPAAAESGLSLRAEFPYSLQGQESAATGPLVKALLVAENTASHSQTVNVRFSLPPGFTPVQLPAGWRAEGNTVEGTVGLTGGYGQWFELFSFNCEQAAAGEYTAVLTYSTSEETREVSLAFSLGKPVVSDKAELALKRVTFPIDRYGEIDRRLNANTLVLRDKTLDYLKNVLKGKGAYDEAAESAHPLTYVRLEFANPARTEKLLVVTFSLLDSLGSPVAGLTTPASNVDDKEAGGFSGNRNGTVALVALNGSPEQVVDLPLYTDDQAARTGSYLLEIQAREGESTPLVVQVPVHMVANNSRTSLTVGLGVLITGVGLIMLLRRWRVLLAGLKTRWLITIALFSSASFVAVNVPSTLLGDVVHLLLGPLAFLITGMFNSIILYMLITSLAVLIPVPGAIALLFVGRMLLNMLVFGHASPPLFLFYGIQATLLEIGIYLARLYANRDRTAEATPKGEWLLLPLACALADSASTFINLHTLSFLYRIFYADWYIAATILVSGFLYTAIGARCGVLLGNQLRRVGSE